MASSPDAGRSRHVGRIVDPLVREDGDPEPELELGADAPAPSAEAAGTDEEIGEAPSSQVSPSEPQPPPPPSEQQSTADEEASEPLLRGRALRERLLARAESARRGGEPPQGLEDVGREPELDPAIGRAPSAPSVRRRAQLSPDMIAVFGTLLGLATVASLVALAMNLEPHQAGLLSQPPEAQPAAPAEKTTPTVVPKRARTRVPGPWRIADAKGDAGVRVVEGKIGLLPFLRAVTEAGVQKKDAYRLLTAFKGVRDFDKPNRSDSFFALIERGSGKLKAFEYLITKEEVYQAREGADGLLVGKRLDLKVSREQVKGALVYTGGDLDESAERGGFDRGLSQALAKAVDGHLSLQEIERGDMLRVVAQEVTVLGEFSRYSGVEAVEWRPAKGKPLRLYYFRGASSRGYFDDSGRSPYEGGWRKPIPTAPITSKFNPKRMHPVLKKVMPHTGTDFGAPSGAPVGASSYGTISYIGYAGASGNLVKIEHGSEIETGYAHLSRFADGLKVGDKVKRLQVVGYVGSTGRSTGPHLHFTVKKNGEFIDPESLNLDGMRVLPKEERAAFQQVKAKYDALLDAIELPKALPVEEAPTQVASAESEAGEPDLDPTGDVPGSGAEPAEPPGKSPAPPPQPKTPAAPPVAAAPAPKSKGNPVYLTDKELMQMQPGSDDGEVNE